MYDDSRQAVDGDPGVLSLACNEYPERRNAQIDLQMTSYWHDAAQ